MASLTCPWCSAPRVAEPSCPRCGANYAKAEQIRVQGKAAGKAESPGVKELVPPQDSLAGLPEVEDKQLEWWFCVAATPAALVLGVFFHLALPGTQRIFLGMP